MEKHINPEVVIVGAGIGGSALATVLARAGIAVTLLEKSLVHIDHVRGEWLAPWGVAETQRLGLYETLLAAGGHHLGRHIGYGDDIDAATAESQLLDFNAFANAGFKPPLCMRHPDMCDLLNAEAIKSGAELLRGVTDLQVIAGAAPEVRFRHDGRRSQVHPAHRRRRRRPQLRRAHASWHRSASRPDASPDGRDAGGRHRRMARGFADFSALRRASTFSRSRNRPTACASIYVTRSTTSAASPAPTTRRVSSTRSAWTLSP